MALPKHTNRSNGYVPPKGFVRPTVSIEELSQFSEQSPEPSPLAPPTPLDMASPANTNDNNHTSSSSRRHSHTPMASPSPTATTTTTLRRNDRQEEPLSRHRFSSQKENNHNVNVDIDMDDECNRTAPRPSLLIPEAPSPHSPPSASLFSEMEGQEASKRRFSRPSHRNNSNSNNSNNNPHHSLPMTEVRLTHSNHPSNGQGGDEFSSSTQCSGADVSTAVPPQQPAQASKITGRLYPALLQLKHDLQQAHQALFLLEQENKALRCQYEKEQTMWQDEQDEILAKERQDMQGQHDKEMADLQGQLEQVEEEEHFLNDQLASTQKERDEMQLELEKCLDTLKQVQNDHEQSQQEMQERQEAAVQAVETTLSTQVEYWKKELSTAHQEYRTKLASRTLEQQELKEVQKALEQAHSTMADLRAEKLALRQELLQAKVRPERAPTAEMACQTDPEETDLLLSQDMMPPLSACSEKDEVQVDHESHVSTITSDDHDALHSAEDMPKPTQPSTWSVENHLGSPSVNRWSQIAATDKDLEHEWQELRERHEGEIRQLIMSHQPSEGKRLDHILEEKNGSRDSLVAKETLRSLNGSDRIRQAQQQQEQLDEMKQEITAAVTQEAVRVVFSALGVTPPGPTPKSRGNASPSDTQFPVSTLNESERDEFLASMKEELTRVVTEKALRVVVEATGQNNIPVQHDIASPGSSAEKGTSTESNKSSSRKKGLLSLQREWQDETNELLDTIQKECNQVFERTRTQRTRTSPRTVAVADFDVFADTDRGMDEEAEELFADNDEFSPHLHQDSDFPGSPGMDLDRTLDETEALVRSLLGTE